MEGRQVAGACPTNERLRTRAVNDKLTTVHGLLNRTLNRRFDGYLSTPLLPGRSVPGCRSSAGSSDNPVRGYGCTISTWASAGRLEKPSCLCPSQPGTSPSAGPPAWQGLPSNHPLPSPRTMSHRIYSVPSAVSGSVLARANDQAPLRRGNRGSGWRRPSHRPGHSTPVGRK